MEMQVDGDTGIRIVERLPTAEEHRRIAEAVGWGHAFDLDRLPDSLERSLCGVVMLDGETVVGMGRVVGDGVMYFYIQDVAVLPAYQRRGLGALVLQALLAWITPLAPSFVGLFATPDGMSLYQNAGFQVGDMVGLFQVLASDRD
jgi:ribosomal protein S18 acetylase RimI-like enzyme